MTRRQTALVLLATICLTACAVLQAATPPAPKNPTQGVILASYETAAVVNAASDSWEQGLISKAALQKVLNGAGEAQIALGLARAALDGGDLTTAAGQLKTARLLLTTIRSLLGGDA